MSLFVAISRPRVGDNVQTLSRPHDRGLRLKIEEGLIGEGGRVSEKRDVLDDVCRCTRYEILRLLLAKNLERMVRIGSVRQGLPWAQSLRPGLHQTRRTWGPCPKVWPPCSFQTKSRPRPRCGSHVLDMSRNKRGYLHGSPTTAPAAFKEAAYHGGLCCVRACAACVLVYMQALAARPT